MATTNTVYKSTGVIASGDYKEVSWVGKTKDGKAVTVKMANAINLGNIDWTFAEKDDVVPEIAFTGVYSNSDATASSTEGCFEVIVAGSPSAGAGEILLGTGAFYIGNTAVALCRGGGKFTVEREYREINADGDRGPVKDRIVLEGERVTLTMNVLSMLTNIESLYPAMGHTTTT